MKEPKYPHFFLHFLLEKLLVGKSDTEKVALSLSEITTSLSVYSQNYPNPKCSLPDKFYSEDDVIFDCDDESRVDSNEVKNTLEGFLKLKPVSEGTDPIYELSQSIVPDEFVVPYSIRRAIERLVQMNDSAQSGMLIAPAGGCKTGFAEMYQNEYPLGYEDETGPTYISLIPGSTPAQLYYQLLVAISPEAIPVRDEKGLYTPTEENLWALRLDVHHVLEDIFRGRQLLIDNADRISRRTLGELEDLADRFQSDLSIVLIGRNELAPKLKFPTDDHWRFTKNILFFPTKFTYDEVSTAFGSILSDEASSESNQSEDLIKSSKTLANFIDSPNPVEPDSPNAEAFEDWREKIILKYRMTESTRTSDEMHQVVAGVERDKVDAWNN